MFCLSMEEYSSNESLAGIRISPTNPPLLNEFMAMSIITVSIEKPQPERSPSLTLKRFSILKLALNPRRSINISFTAAVSRDPGAERRVNCAGKRTICLFR